MPPNFGDGMPDGTIARCWGRRVGAYGEEVGRKDRERVGGGATALHRSRIALAHPNHWSGRKRVGVTDGLGDGDAAI